MRPIKKDILRVLKGYGLEPSRDEWVDELADELVAAVDWVTK